MDFDDESAGVLSSLFFPVVFSVPVGLSVVAIAGSVVVSGLFSDLAKEDSVDLVVPSTSSVVVSVAVA